MVVTLSKKDVAGVVFVLAVLAFGFVRGMLAAGAVDELSDELDRIRSERLEATIDSLEGRPDPRVELSHGALYYQAPEPVRWCSWPVS